MPVKFDWSNWVVEWGGNPLRLHCMPAWLNQSNWVEIHRDYIVCLPDQMGGRIGWKSIDITLYACLVELGGNLLRLHCMPASQIRPVELGGPMGWKSIDITLYACWSNWVEIY